MLWGGGAQVYLQHRKNQRRLDLTGAPWGRREKDRQEAQSWLGSAWGLVLVLGKRGTRGEREEQTRPFSGWVSDNRVSSAQSLEPDSPGFKPEFA